jgi:hypothetical protein
MTRAAEGLLDAVAAVEANLRGDEEGVKAILNSGGRPLLTGLLAVASRMSEGHEDWLGEFRDWVLHEMS